MCLRCGGKYYMDFTKNLYSFYKQHNIPVSQLVKTTMNILTQCQGMCSNYLAINEPPINVHKLC